MRRQKETANLMAQEKPLSKNERTQRAPCKYEHMMNQVSFLSQTFTRLEKAQNFVRRALLMGQRFRSPVCEWILVILVMALMVPVRMQMCPRWSMPMEVQQDRVLLSGLFKVGDMPVTHLFPIYFQQILCIIGILCQFARESKLALFVWQSVCTRLWNSSVAKLQCYHWSCLVGTWWSVRWGRSFWTKRSVKFLIGLFGQRWKWGEWWEWILWT